MTDVSEIGCIGKTTYKSKADAIIYQRERVKRNKCQRATHKEKKRSASRLQPYRCERCHHWHLGTLSDGGKMR